MEPSIMSGYQMSYEQYRQLAINNAMSPHRSWPPSPTLAKNETGPRLPLLLMVIPLFLLMTAAPLLSAILRPQPPSASRITLATMQHLASDNHIIHTHSVPSDDITPHSAAAAISSNATLHCPSDDDVSLIVRAINDWMPNAMSFNLSSLKLDIEQHKNAIHRWLSPDVSECAIDTDRLGLSKSDVIGTSSGRSIDGAMSPPSSDASHSESAPNDRHNLSGPLLASVEDSSNGTYVSDTLTALFTFDGTYA